MRRRRGGEGFFDLIIVQSRGPVFLDRMLTGRGRAGITLWRWLLVHPTEIPRVQRSLARKLTRTAKLERNAIQRRDMRRTTALLTEAKQRVALARATWLAA